jgi:membrane protein DedA with SNARE-associated domain
MLHLLIAYAYPLMIPLSLVEGPLVALAAAIGASTGRINPLAAYAIVMAGGLFQDVVYYWIGRAAIGSGRVRAFARRTKLVRDTLGPLRDAWRARMFATLVASKFAYGLYAPILVSVGMAKAPFWRFLGESMALSAAVLASWLGLGFCLARLYGGLGRDASWIMAGLGVLAIMGSVFIASHARGRLLPAT